VKPNSLLSGDSEAIKDFPIEKRATITDGLPLELSIKDISILAYPDDKDLQDAYEKDLVMACKNDGLLCYGDINGWNYKDNEPNTFPKVAGYPLWSNWDDGTPDTLWCDPEHCLIHRDNFKSYLQRQEKWPVSGLLANWWSDGELQADTENLGNDEEIKGRLNKQVAFIVKTAIKLGYDDLLNIPEGGRAAIKAECEKNTKLFFKCSFKRAWAEADERGQIRIKDKEKYLSNQ